MSTKTKVRLRAVELVVDKPGGAAHTQRFPWLTAERLLLMPNNGGWRLPIDSELEISPEHGLRTRTNERATKKPKAGRVSKASNTARK